MKILSDERIKTVLLEQGFLISYAEDLTEEEFEWWRGMCKAQAELTREETLQEVGEWMNKHRLFDRHTDAWCCWQALLKGKEVADNGKANHA